MGAAQAERLVSRLEEVGGVLGDLGLALIKVAKFEDEEGARSGAYTLSASASKAIAAEAKRVGTVRWVSTGGRFLWHRKWNEGNLPVRKLGDKHWQQVYTSETQ